MSAGKDPCTVQVVISQDQMLRAKEAARARGWVLVSHPEGAVIVPDGRRVTWRGVAATVATTTPAQRATDVYDAAEHVASYNSLDGIRSDQRYLVRDWVPISISVVHVNGRLEATCELNDAEALYDVLLALLSNP